MSTSDHPAGGGDRRIIGGAIGCPHEHTGDPDRFVGSVCEGGRPLATGFRCARCGGAVLELIEPDAWDDVAAAVGYHYYGRWPVVEGDGSGPGRDE